MLRKFSFAFWLRFETGLRFGLRFETLRLRFAFPRFGSAAKVPPHLSGKTTPSASRLGCMHAGSTA